LIQVLYLGRAFPLYLPILDLNLSVIGLKCTLLSIHHIGFSSGLSRLQRLHSFAQNVSDLWHGLILFDSVTSGAATL
jgi:hypothetical protein